MSITRLMWLFCPWYAATSISALRDERLAGYHRLVVTSLKGLLKVDADELGSGIARASDQPARAGKRRRKLPTFRYMNKLRYR